MSIFPLHEHPMKNDEIRISYINPNTNMKLFPEYEIPLLNMVVGNSDIITVAFSDNLNTGLGTSDDTFIDEYITTQLSNAYRKHIFEWIGDYFRIDDIYVSRDPNNLSRIIIKTKIACKNICDINKYESKINVLEGELNVKSNLINNYKNIIKYERNKSILTIIIERLKRKFIRG